MHNIKLKEAEQLCENIQKGIWLSLKRAEEAFPRLPSSWEPEDEWVESIKWKGAFCIRKSLGGGRKHFEETRGNYL